MKITAVCQFNGRVYTMDFPNMTETQFRISKKMWDEGALIQEAFPYLNADQREFLMTGTPPELWTAMFSDHDAREDYDADDRASSDRSQRYYNNCD